MSFYYYYSKYKVNDFKRYSSSLYLLKILYFRRYLKTYCLQAPTIVLFLFFYESNFILSRYMIYIFRKIIAAVLNMYLISDINLPEHIQKDVRQICRTSFCMCKL